MNDSLTLIREELEVTGCVHFARKSRSLHRRYSGPKWNLPAKLASVWAPDQRAVRSARKPYSLALAGFCWCP
jgi:hypothetical protein